MPSPFTLPNIKRILEEHAVRGCENLRYFTSLTPSLTTTFFLWDSFLTVYTLDEDLMLLSNHPFIIFDVYRLEWSRR